MKTPIAIVCFVFGTIGIGAPATPPATADADSLWCPLAVGVDTFTERPDAVLFTLWSESAAGYASGTIVYFIGTSRYRLPFSHSIAADKLNKSQAPTPFLVQFDAPARIDSAYVETLAGGPCEPHSPYIAKELQTGVPADRPKPRYELNWSETLRALAQHADALAPGTPETVDAPACAKPYVAARTTLSIPPETPPGMSWRGVVIVSVAIDATGAVRGTRVDVSSTSPIFDALSVKVAQRSRFAAAIYRCRPVSGTYWFSVGWNS